MAVLELDTVETIRERRKQRRRDQADRAAERCAGGRVPFQGRGVHCAIGRPVALGVGAVLVKHETCALDVCNCPCHWGGKP